MTRKEFEQLRVEIQKQKLQLAGDCGPMSFAVQRAAFKQEQLKKLVKLGKQVKDSRTVAAKLKRWERQIAKLSEVPRRFEQLTRMPVPTVSPRV